MDGITIQSFTAGSVMVNALASQAPSQDPVALFNTINNNLNTISLPNFTLLTSTITAIGFTPNNNDNSTSSSSSSSNLPLIVGITVGGAVILVIIIGNFIDI
jgi:hypothetical protein